MFPSRHRGAVGAEQEGLGAMVLDLRVGGCTGMEGHEGQAGDKLAPQSAVNLHGSPGLGPGVTCRFREF